jgi:hypothetical protein
MTKHIYVVGVGDDAPSLTRCQIKREASDLVYVEYGQENLTGYALINRTLHRKHDLLFDSESEARECLSTMQHDEKALSAVVEIGETP